MWSFREVTSVNGLFWGSFVGIISAGNRGEFKFVIPRSLTTSPSPFVILLSAPEEMRIKTHTRVILRVLPRKKIKIKILNLLNSFHHWLCHRCLPALLYICLIWNSHLTCYLLKYTTTKSRGALEERGEEILEREFSSKEVLLPHILLAFLSHSQHLGFVCVCILFKASFCFYFHAWRPLCPPQLCNRFLRGHFKAAESESFVIRELIRTTQHEISQEISKRITINYPAGDNRYITDHETVASTGKQSVSLSERFISTERRHVGMQWTRKTFDK